ncbi:hypothetical protein AGDE_16214 [Angomonas deanei]|uniref:Beta-lactamase superfamily domain containing protein n=1 Tax=Angomonas deanei TaxID=59799 RepID=A0A7G2CLT4_9TRYP|nr:hypothetical protein AGDE_16214 [Angomonas deanei]CAD2219884.1 hypothetical protein, conserved [Angomonas deanei]|eukprot:EPY17501.1 hypothetical protein AGDE_16214 [Angomonas deanei]
MAALPIGAYAPRWFMSSAHIDPQSAVEILRILSVKKAYAVHWATFELSEEAADDPPRELLEYLREEGVEEERFLAIQTGGHLAF